MVGGFLDTPWLGILWVAGAALDVFSAINAGKGTFAIDAKHSAERFGLLSSRISGFGFYFSTARVETVCEEDDQASALDFAESPE